MFTTSQHAHFIGIGGIGMSGIAEILLSLGMKVSAPISAGPCHRARLAQLGATIYEDTSRQRRWRNSGRHELAVGR